MKLVVQIWSKPLHWLMGMKIIANGKKTSKMIVGKYASKNNPKTNKKLINIGVYLNIPVNGRNEILSLFLKFRSMKSSLLVAIIAMERSNTPRQQAHSSPLPSLAINNKSDS